ncbi:hypothetical protein HC891_08890, partial [Candidatus Gracilibacteria bacterium]|nr:hypothetical protein [Candidatus Gracilibacteria bacterium]
AGVRGGGDGRSAHRREGVQARRTRWNTCGSGKIVYAISVFADDGAQYAGCGVPGRIVTFSIDSTILPYRAFWNNSRPQQLGLTYLPIVRGGTRSRAPGTELRPRFLVFGSCFSQEKSRIYDR